VKKYHNFYAAAAAAAAAAATCSAKFGLKKSNMVNG
jgi:hypothetical protein